MMSMTRAEGTGTTSVALDQWSDSLDQFARNVFVSHSPHGQAEWTCRLLREESLMLLT
jgi:hypothetical protein